MSAVLDLQKLAVETPTGPEFSISWSSCDSNSCNKKEN